MSAPSSTPNYRFICGQYVLHRGDSPVSAPTDEVALALSAESGLLHKHGKPETVLQWAAQARRQLSVHRGDKSAEENALAREMALDIVVLQGRFALEDLNRCITSSGYAGTLYKAAKAGTLQAVDLLGRPRS